MDKLPKYYWDACAWIGLIKREPTRIDSLQFVIKLAQDRKVEIWTSTFTLAEVFKKNCGAAAPSGIEPSQDKDFEDFLLQDFVHLVQVNADVGIAARRLLRLFPELRKPQDAIHAATAILYDCDELHTFDGCDLLPLDGKLPTKEASKFLRICKPPDPPPEPIPEPQPDPDKGTLFEKKQSTDDDEKSG